MPKVDVGVACSGAQRPEWWNGVMSELLGEQHAGIEIGRIHAISSAVPDHNKNAVIDKRRSRLTDVNRNAILGGFLDGDSEWLWFIDDDTIPPRGTLGHLLSLGKAAVGGLYYQSLPPCDPIAYLRQPNGLYAALGVYPHGAIMEIDSIGMGCTLVHRSVFEKIKAGFRLVQRPNGSLMPVHQSKFKTGFSLPAEGEYVSGGYLHTPVVDMAEGDERTFPFFAMEYCRTEDHFFWELAEQVGVKPWVDTAITCQHLKTKKFGLDDYWPYRNDVLKAHLREAAPTEPEAVEMSQIVLDVGAGDRTACRAHFPDAEAIVSLDVDPTTGPDIVADITLPLHSDLHGKFDAIHLCHVLEHINWAQVITTLQYLSAALRPGGDIYIYVPALEWAAMEILKPTTSSVIMPFIYGSQSTPWQYHRSGFTLKTLRQCCVLAGLLPFVAMQETFIVQTESGDYPAAENYVIARKPLRTTTPEEAEKALAR